MKIFDFLVKTAIFRTFLLFSGDYRQALPPYTVWLEHLIRTDMHDENLSEKRRNAQKMAILTKKMKNFHKSKVEGLEKLPTRAYLYYDLLHFKGCHFT